MTPTEVLKMLKRKIDAAGLNKCNYAIETSDIEAINQALLLHDVMQCFYFGFSDDYPSGFISITKENAEKLQRRGWTVSFHTDYYVNSICAEYKELVIGFGSWMDNLTPFISTGDYQEIVKIKNREQLDKFLQLIESTWQFSNIA
jgi:hypothetical protein